MGMCVLAFGILFAYALCRPTVESLYIRDWGAQRLPEVWIAGTAVMLASVAAYNGSSRRVPLPRLMVIGSGTAAGLLLALLALRPLFGTGATFALYVWKDVWVVVLLEMFWTLANVAFGIRSARWLYGLFLVCGSLGGILGNLSVGAVAKAAGTEWALMLGAPALVVVAALAALVGGLSGLNALQPPAPEAATPRSASVLKDLGLLRTSRYLLTLLCLILITQLLITAIDFQFNSVMETAHADDDQRTAAIGEVYAAIDGSALVLQALSGPALRALGVPAIMFLIPTVLGGGLLWSFTAGALEAVTFLKIASKALDYSLFRAAKEILYIPLGYAEKTRGKALIDMLGYRFAKALASLPLKVLVALSLVAWVPAVALALVAGWLLLVRPLVAGYRRLLRGRDRSGAPAAPSPQEGQAREG